MRTFLWVFFFKRIPLALTSECSERPILVWSSKSTTCLTLDEAGGLSHLSAQTRRVTRWVAFFFFFFCVLRWTVRDCVWVVLQTAGEGGHWLTVTKLHVVPGGNQTRVLGWSGRALCHLSHLSGCKQNFLMQCTETATTINLYKNRIKKVNWYLNFKALLIKVSFQARIWSLPLSPYSTKQETNNFWSLSEGSPWTRWGCGHYLWPPENLASKDVDL